MKLYPDKDIQFVVINNIVLSIVNSFIPQRNLWDFLHYKNLNNLHIFLDNLYNIGYNIDDMNYSRKR